MFNGDFTCHFWETIWWILGPISKVHRLLKWSDFYTCTYVYDLCATIKQDRSNQSNVCIYLVGGAMCPSWNIWKSMGRIIPCIMGKDMFQTTNQYIYNYIYIIDISQTTYDQPRGLKSAVWSQIQVLIVVSSGPLWCLWLMGQSWGVNPECIWVNYTTGWWFQPLWKILISWDDYSELFHIYDMEIMKHVPNHQPE